MEVRGASASLSMSGLSISGSSSSSRAQPKQLRPNKTTARTPMTQLQQPSSHSVACVALHISSLRRHLAVNNITSLISPIPNPQLSYHSTLLHYSPFTFASANTRHPTSLLARTNSLTNLQQQQQQQQEQVDIHASPAQGFCQEDRPRDQRPQGKLVALSSCIAPRK